MQVKRVMCSQLKWKFPKISCPILSADDTYALEFGFLSIFDNPGEKVREFLYDLFVSSQHMSELPKTCLDIWTE